MRTTVTLADDVAAEIVRMRRDDGVGISDALNQLARRGMTAPPAFGAAYRHVSAPLGIRVDVSNIGDVLDMLDEHG